MTKNISTQFVEHWSEKERWCLGKLTLSFTLPLDAIEVCDRSKAISKTGTTKSKDVYVNICEIGFFKNGTNANADFTTRLVSKGGLYSWYEGSKEDNAFLLEKAGFIRHECCTPYLAHVKANPNCKVDMELFQVDTYMFTKLQLIRWKYSHQRA